MDAALRDIRKALTRLKSSDTYLKRRNALKAFDRAVAALRSGVQEKFPKLRKDGSVIIPRRQKGVACPVCRVPMKSFVLLAGHLEKKHRYACMPHRSCTDTYKRCFCGKGFRTFGHLAKHLASVKELKVHYGLSVLKESAGIK